MQNHLDEGNKGLAEQRELEVRRQTWMLAHRSLSSNVGQYAPCCLKIHTTEGGGRHKLAVYSRPRNPFSGSWRAISWFSEAGLFELGAGLFFRVLGILTMRLCCHYH